MEKESLLTEIWEIQTTVAEASDAEKIAGELVERRLAACVQIQPVLKSFYRWEGKVQAEPELKLTIKTSAEAREACLAAIGELHPYDLPEIAGRPLAWVAEDYAAWVTAQTTPEVIHARLAWKNTNEAPSFESVFEVLSNKPNVHAELDGCFVWRSFEQGRDRNPRWLLDGMVYDRDGAIAYIELKGKCDRKLFTELLDGCAVGELRSVKIQCVESGEWMEAERFVYKLW